MIIISLICFYGQRCFTQTQPAYYPNNSMQEYHGTWEWGNNKETLTIFLQTEKIWNSLAECYIDILVGWHKYQKLGGLVIESSFEYSPNILFRTIDLSNSAYQFPTGTIKDLTKNKVCRLYLKLMQNPLVMEWKLEGMPGINIQPKINTSQEEYTLPHSVILKKL